MEIEFTSVPGLRLRLVTIHGGNDSYLTNDRDPGDHCYEQRWDMEILNKDLKSNLKIDHLIGKNLNAEWCAHSDLCYSDSEPASLQFTIHSFPYSLRKIKRLLKCHSISTGGYRNRSVSDALCGQITISFL